MDIKKMILVFAAAVAVMAAVSACTPSGQEEAVKSASVPPTAVPAETAEEPESGEQQADPQAALDEIYSSIGRSEEAVNPTREEVQDVIGLDMETVEEFYIRYLPADFGAADVYIVKPKTGEKEAVIEALKERQEQRIREFTDYDIYNSTEISENALIFTQGDYVVMLMLEDNDAGRAIVEKYIPNNMESKR